MENLSHVLRKAISKKKLHTTGYMGVILHTLNGIIDDQIEQGYVKHGVLYIRIKDQGKKTAIFVQKSRILADIHKKLQEYGYIVTIKDIRFLV